MSSMPASEFKSKCLKVIERIAETGEPVVVTKHGRPVVQVIPVTDGAPVVFGRLAGAVTREDDIVSPIGDPLIWRE